MANYREVPEEDREAFQETLHYAFSPHKEEVDYHDDEDYWPSMGDLRGIYDNGELLAVSSIHYLNSHLRGKWLPMGGVSAVATSPGNRHRGYIKNMLAEMLAELRDKGIALSCLWPFSYPFYDRLGWRVCDNYTTYELDPEVLKFTADEPGGEFRQVSKGEHEIIEPTYRKFARKFNLPLKRSPEWWDHHRFSQWDKQVYCYLWKRKEEVKGYVLYSAEKGPQGEWKKKLKVDELVYESEEAFFQLLRFLYNHGSQMSQITLPGPIPGKLSLLDLVEDPRDVKALEKPGIMVRCVDVKKALESLTYPENPRGEITMKVKDPLLEANSGTYYLVFDGSSSDPEVDRATENGDDPDLSLEVGSLTQLYTGYLSPRQAVTANKITLSNRDKLELLEKIFPAGETLFYDGF